MRKLRKLYIFMHLTTLGDSGDAQLSFSFEDK